MKLNTALVDNARIICTPENTAPGINAGPDSNAQINNTFAPDVTLTVEWSDTCSPLGWSTAGVMLQVTPLDAILETVKASVPADSPVPRGFLHVKITRP